jgi:hypothetical protein
MQNSSEGDGMIFLKHADATLKAFNVPQAENDEPPPSSEARMPTSSKPHKNTAHQAW